MTIFFVAIWLITGSHSLLAVTTNTHVGEAVAASSTMNVGGLSGWGLTLLIVIALDLAGGLRS